MPTFQRVCIHVWSQHAQKKNITENYWQYFYECCRNILCNLHSNQLFLLLSIFARNFAPRKLHSKPKTNILDSLGTKFEFSWDEVIWPFNEFFHPKRQVVTWKYLFWFTISTTNMRKDKNSWKRYIHIYSDITFSFYHATRYMKKCIEMEWIILIISISMSTVSSRYFQFCSAKRLHFILIWFKLCEIKLY